jgi:predicted DNA-binding protein with PD1-like motif
MQTRLLHEDNGQRTFAVILETGEEVLTCLQQFVTREHVLAAQITAIGALSEVDVLRLGPKGLSEDSGARTD